MQDIYKRLSIIGVIFLTFIIIVLSAVGTDNSNTTKNKTVNEEANNGKRIVCTIGSKKYISFEITNEKVKKYKKEEYGCVHTTKDESEECQSAKQKYIDAISRKDCEQRNNEESKSEPIYYFCNNDDETEFIYQYHYTTITLKKLALDYDYKSEINNLKDEGYECKNKKD